MIDGQLVFLSEEEIVQCDTATGYNGCRGGSMQQAFGWAKLQGHHTEDSYTHTSGGGVHMIDGPAFLAEDDYHRLKAASTFHAVHINNWAMANAFVWYDEQACRSN